MPRERVSVVIPVYNLGDYLDKCVDSVVTQSRRPSEIIIVDNGSSDNSVEIAHRLHDQYPELVIVTSEVRRGAPAARNHGLSIARGDWIQFLDGDDLLLPNKIQTQLTYAQTDTGLICGATIEVVHGKGEKKVDVLPDVLEGLFVGGGALGFTSSNLWSRKAVMDVGGWDESLSSSQEYDLMFRMISQGCNVVVVPQHLTVRHMRPDQISSQNQGRRIYNYLCLRSRMLEYLEENELISTAQSHQFIRHYLERYTRLRRHGPRLAGRLRKNQLRSLRARDSYRSMPGKLDLKFNSFLRTLKARIEDVIYLRWKKFLRPHET